MGDPNPIDPTFPPIIAPDYGTMDDDGGGSGQTIPPKPPKPPKPEE